MNPFSQLISNQFLTQFENAIDSLLEKNALSLSCTLNFNNENNQKYCNNCLYDNITKTSSNTYNSTGPIPFEDYNICPVCLGEGVLSSTVSSEKLDLGIIFDSKYFYNLDKFVNLSYGTIQTICTIKYLSDIRNANDLIINNTIQYGSYIYQRAEDPMICGLGDRQYIITTWTRK